ncbi:MAG TPA: fatty acid desaturase [Gemmatimonadaceae bacterium]|jgi:omega-6 fatty acid desaturase (delta-12 desaturase)|nr:fatty acid desaturase [Gemmatimonadaceae bacterium]
MSRVAPPKAGVHWRQAVEPFTGPSAPRAALQLATTLVPLALTMWATRVAMPVSPLLAALFVFPAAGLLIRTFILMHDCAHGSFFATRRVNDAVGFVTGVLTLTPFTQWRRDHALHHASSGDLDRRGHGDVKTLTVREYVAKPPLGRLAYRVVRHPLLLLIGGPFYLALSNRISGQGASSGPRQIANVWLTNAVIGILLTVAFLTLGWATVVLAYLLPFYLAAMAGVWLFYVQHQFTDAYWSRHEDWDYVEAALRGSSHLRLPPVLQWFTGSIGLHHVHHVAPKIPNYRLQPCHDANEMFHGSPVVTLRSGTAGLRLALWDEERKRLVRFRDVAPARHG